LVSLRNFLWLHGPMNYRGIFFAALLTTLFPNVTTVASAQSNSAVSAKDAEENAALRKEWESWNAPFKPFRIIGNIHYVGPAGISSFLITTPAGHILLDTGFETTVPRIRDSVTKLGFRMEDIKIILNSHAHLDHAGGHASMKQLTGAQILMSEADAALLAGGGTNDFTPFSAEMKGFRPARADRLLQDGEKVTLGDTTLTCHLTPGHTRGCTTWTMDVMDDGKVRHVVFFGSTSLLPGVALANNPRYPRMPEDFRETFRKLKALPCDVFLAPHAGFFGLNERFERLERGEKPNPFVDPDAFKSFIASAEKKFLDQLEQEKKKP
jgi:metallo-beta-lactamase class B